MVQAFQPAPSSICRLTINTSAVSRMEFVDPRKTPFVPGVRCARRASASLQARVLLFCDIFATADAILYPPPRQIARRSRTRSRTRRNCFGTMIRRSRSAHVLYQCPKWRSFYPAARFFILIRRDMSWCRGALCRTTYMLSSLHWWETASTRSFTRGRDIRHARRIDCWIGAGHSGNENRSTT